MAKRPIYYDTETTGISIHNDSIIELAAYDPVLDKTFDELINPNSPIPPQATAVHHITDDMVKDKPTFKEVAERFVEFCSGDVVLIAHNNDGFDEPFMKNEFKRCGLEFPNLTFLDSLKWARRYRKDMPRHTLQILRETYGFEANNAHRALDDVKILHQVFKALTDDLEIEQILELLNKSQTVHVMPFGKFKGKPLDSVPQDYVTWLAKGGALDKKENSDLKKSFEKFGLVTQA